MQFHNSTLLLPWCGWPRAEGDTILQRTTVLNVAFRPRQSPQLNDKLFCPLLCVVQSRGGAEGPSGAVWICKGFNCDDGV